MKVLRLVVVAFMAVSGSVMAEEITRMQSATSLLQNEEWEKSAKLFEEIVGDEPENALAWIQLARAYDELGEFDKELDAAQKSIDVTREELTLLLGGIDLQKTRRRSWYERPQAS